MNQDFALTRVPPRRKTGDNGQQDSPSNTELPGDQGREVSEPKPAEWRTEFRRDYGRILHSHGFRRLRNKTQLFPLNELDFFRTRLTHSVEVAQIAKCIALKINSQYPDAMIDLDLVESAGLAHDIGHPPFGHVGERALHEMMQQDGGFEGNAQTLRLLARLEKKVKGYGLNLTYRTLASVLKQCEKIPRDVGAKKKKGYYESEATLVQAIQDKVLAGHPLRDSKDFRTRECAIMDIADDIAYAVYDLEDSFKGGFLSAMDMLACSNSVANNLRAKIADDSETPDSHKSCTVEQVQEALQELALLGLNDVMKRALAKSKSEEEKESCAREKYKETPKKIVEATGDTTIHQAAGLYKASKNLARKSRLRTAFTSKLIGRFIEQISYEPNEQAQALSNVQLAGGTHFEVLVVKYFTFQLVINSPKIQLRETNAYNIVSKMFEMLWRDTRGSNLPLDYRKKYVAPRMMVEDYETKREDNNLTEQQYLSERATAKRVLCDFIAGMTDSYAVEFYGRLTSLTPITIFKDF